MNINYGEIITKANARKVALEDITEYAKQAEEMAHELKFAATYFIDLAAKVAALDGEGKVLLGVDITGAVFYSGLAVEPTLKATAPSGRITALLTALGNQQ